MTKIVEKRRENSVEFKVPVNDIIEGKDIKVEGTEREREQKRCNRTVLCSRPNMDVGDLTFIFVVFIWCWYT